MENVRGTFEQLYKCIYRKGKDELYEFLKTSGYFEAPASSQYHLAYDGGLLEHSINVTKMMLELSDNPIIFDYMNYSQESVIIIGLFHDLGKATYFNKPNYVENILKSGKRSEAKPYETNKQLLNIPHEVSSIHILSQYIELTEEETFAILYHNGLYTSLGYSLKNNERPLQQLLHYADMWCSRFVESRGV